MEMYLQHYFNPDFDYLQLQPSIGAKGQTDLYNLGYVQNVVKGQILAEIKPLHTVEEPLPRYLLDKPVFPQGPNTYINPEYPNYLLSSVNGYVFYYNGKISVKKVLNVRSNVDFHTGNIVFVGDIVVHKDVKAGFQVQANNILIKGMVEGGEVRSRNDMKILGGARGGVSNRCLLAAGGGLQVNFCEKVELRAQKKLCIDRFCMQCKVYAGEGLIVSGMTVGGIIHVLKYILVKDTLGNKAGVPTKIFLGYDPFRLRELERCEARLESLNEKITTYTNIAGPSPQKENEINRELENALQKREHLVSLQQSLWQTLQLNEFQASKCRLIVLGIVYPGVEITIGQTTYSVTEELQNVSFKLSHNTIIIESAPTHTNTFFEKQ